MDPFILAKVLQSPPEEDQDLMVSLVIFEWQDDNLIGVYPSPTSTAKVWKVP